MVPRWSSRPVRSAVTSTLPKRPYIAGENATANTDLSALFSAMADVAMGRYAVARYRKVEVKTNWIPELNGTEAMMEKAQ